MQQPARIRVILLDDNNAIRNIFSELLTDRGYEVFTFSTPAICPMQIEKNCQCGTGQTCVDIIISDMDMPQITGLGFIEKQKEKNCKCRFIALMSGLWTDVSLTRAHELGCKTFEKPFSFDEVCEWLDEIEKEINPGRDICNWFMEKNPMDN